ncbi:MAG TPA: hypothetical protein VNF72_04315 [Myxococcota bacterium]|nr:hypothetical protein [Myxococcota bacterium]
MHMQVSDTRPARAGNAALTLALVLAVAVGACVAFAPALRAGFVSWDDGLTVTDNFAIREHHAASLRWMWTTSHAGHYQPLAWTSLALDHALHGLSAPDFPEARGFHATNLLLHAVGAVALFALAFTLYGRAGGAAATSSPAALACAAALAALLHAVHPLRCESVCWVTERRDVLSAPFFLLALVAYLRAAPRGPVQVAQSRWLAVCAICALAALALFAASISLADPAHLALHGPGLAGVVLACALLGVAALAAARGVDPAGTPRRGAWLLASLALLGISLCAKAWGIVVPALLCILDAWPLARVPLRAREASALPTRRALVALLVEKLPFAVLALVFARLATWAQTAQQGHVDVLSVHTPGERVVQALYGLAFYPAKTLLPTGLAPLYPVPDDIHLGEPRFLVGALATLALSAGALVLVRRMPALCAAWLAYAVTVAPVLGVLQSGPQLVADRYAYLAGIPFALLAGSALLAAWRRGTAVRTAATVAALAAIAVLGALSWRQSGIWRNSETLWLRAYAAAPDSPLAALNLGLVRAQQAASEDDPARRKALRDDALRLVREAAALRPASGLYRINEAIVLADRAADVPEPARSDDLAQADRLARTAIESGEANGLAEASWYFQHGRMLAAAGRLDEASARYERALALRPEWPVPRLWIASAELELAQREAADAPAEALARVLRAERELELAARAAGPTRSIESAQAFASELRAALERRL